MIQRVQSLYLLYSIVFMAIFAFTPYLNIVTTDATYQLSSTGMKATQVVNSTAAIVASSPQYAVAIIACLTIIMSVIAIFLFNNRVRQMLVCRINILFYIALYAVMGIYAFTTYDHLQAISFKTTTYVIFPICALITNWLALSAINKDEQMVRDSERMWTRNK